MTTYEVVIVGAGPAGLSAALLLGRCRRRVLVVDHGRPRNLRARWIHCFLTRDGAPPDELRRVGREQLRRYESVTVRDLEAVDARCVESGFEVDLAGGERARCRKLLLASGVVDQLPRIDGIEPLWGKSVFHCPYCDAYELRDQPIAVLGDARLALAMTQWTRDVVLVTNGEDVERVPLERHKIGVRTARIARLEGKDGMLSRIVFSDGGSLARRALFLHPAMGLQSPLALRVGCQPTDKGVVDTGWHARTNVEGVYVAGDASRDVQLAIIAAAEGTQAAFEINKALLHEDLGLD
jgi:thioredoxin reductase